MKPCWMMAAFTVVFLLAAAEPAGNSKRLTEEEYRQLLERVSKPEYHSFSKGKVPAEFTVLVEELRRRHPYTSLADRLAFEKPRAGTAPALPAATAEQLKKLEGGLGFRLSWEKRVESLRMLHSDEVAKFVTREGFGRMRTPEPSLRLLELPPAPPIPLLTLSDLSPDEVGPVVRLPQSDPKPEEPASALPSLDRLGRFHLMGQVNFLNPSGFGHAKDREHVAGFRPHQFRYLPTLAHLPQKKADEKEPWQLRRLELVSLLKHDRPGVYISEQLPRMDRLEKAAVRPLNGFEQKALKSLQQGEELVTEATTNTIRMMGALRAAKQCLDCHSGQRGELLGSFSYEFQRDPPAATAR